MTTSYLIMSLHLVLFFFVVFACTLFCVWASVSNRLCVLFCAAPVCHLNSCLLCISLSVSLRVCVYYTSSSPVQSSFRSFFSEIVLTSTRNRPTFLRPTHTCLNAKKRRETGRFRSAQALRRIGFERTAGISEMDHRSKTRSRHRRWWWRWRCRRGRFNRLRLHLWNNIFTKNFRQTGSWCYKTYLEEIWKF